MAIELMSAAEMEAFRQIGDFCYGPQTAWLLQRIENLGANNGYLNVTDLQLTSLPEELPAGCREFHCEYTQFERLPRLPPGLLSLYCNHMPNLRELPALPDSLQRLLCGYTQLATLPALPRALRTLHCQGMQRLTGLPPLPAGLTHLECVFTPLRGLPPLPAGLDSFIGDYTTLMQCETFPFQIGGGPCPRQFIVYNTPPELVGRFDDPPGTQMRKMQQRYEDVNRPRIARARCAAVKEELMAAAWAPRWGEERLEALAC